MHENETLIVDSLVELADRPGLPRPIRNNNQLVVQAGMCSVLSLVGQRDARLENAVQRAIDTGILEQCERLPHHVMIERTMLDWGGFAHGLPTLSELTASSMLTRLPHALYQSEKTAYQITHDIMFGYEFGERTMGGASLGQQSGLRTLLGDLLVRFEFEGHWDLVGELLLCWDCLGFLHDGVYNRAWHALLQMQDVDGSVPAICPMDSTDDNGAESLTEAQRFSLRYHTTLVLALAATARDRRDRLGRQPAVGPSRRPNSGAIAPPHHETSAAWLAGLLERGSVVPAPKVSMGVLVGMTLLVALDDRVRPQLEQVIPTIVTGLRGAVQFAEIPATLSLTAFGILRRHGHNIPALTQFVTCINEVLATTSPDAETALSWCEKRMVLAKLGLAGTPALPSWDAVWEWLDSDPTIGLGNLCQLVGASSGYGTLAPRELSDAESCDASRLEAIAVDALRRRDLITGCSLLRGVHLLRPLGEDRIDGLSRYLNAQQDHNGAYGFGDSTLRAGASSLGADGIDLDADVRLPTSLAVWWALAELSTNFRLFISLS